MDSNIFKLLDEDEEENGEIRKVYKKIIEDTGKSIQQKLRDVEMEEDEDKNEKKVVKSKAIVGKKNREVRMSKEVSLRTQAKLDKKKKKMSLKAKSKNNY